MSKYRAIGSGPGKLGRLGVLTYSLIALFVVCFGTFTVILVSRLETSSSSSMLRGQGGERGNSGLSLSQKQQEGSGARLLLPDVRATFRPSAAVHEVPVASPVAVFISDNLRINQRTESMKAAELSTMATIVNERQQRLQHQREKVSEVPRLSLLSASEAATATEPSSSPHSERRGSHDSGSSGNLNLIESSREDISLKVRGSSVLVSNNSYISGNAVEIVDTRKLILEHALQGSRDKGKKKNKKSAARQSSQQNRDNAGSLDSFKEVNCDQRRDPFKGHPVESFVPPSAASVEDAAAWRLAVDEMKRGIAKMTIGGEPLRAHIRAEVVRLEVLRMKLFCPHNNNSGGSNNESSR